MDVEYGGREMGREIGKGIGGRYLCCSFDVLGVASDEGGLLLVVGRHYIGVYDLLGLVECFVEVLRFGCGKLGIILENVDL